MNVLLFTGAYLGGRVADQGLANTLGLRTLRHGTNPISWLSIHTFGALPQMGGSRVGGDYGVGFDYQNRGRVYFAKNGHDHYTSYFKNVTMPRVLPRTYTLTSTRNLLNSMHCPRFISTIGGAVTAVALPTIKFRFSEEETNRMYRDNTIPGDMACSTNRWISPLNIGVVGTVWKSLTYKTPIRMAQHPLKVITGVAQLALCGAVAFGAVTYLPAFVVAHKVALIAGVALALI